MIILSAVMNYSAVPPYCLYLANLATIISVLPFLSLSFPTNFSPFHLAMKASPCIRQQLYQEFRKFPTQTPHFLYLRLYLSDHFGTCYFSLLSTLYYMEPQSTKVISCTHLLTSVSPFLATSVNINRFFTHRSSFPHQ